MGISLQIQNVKCRVTWKKSELESGKCKVQTERPTKTTQKNNSTLNKQKVRRGKETSDGGTNKKRRQKMPKPVLSCEECALTFKSYAGWRGHLTRIHQEGRIACAHCTVRFRTATLRNAHFYAAITGEPSTRGRPKKAKKAKNEQTETQKVLDFSGFIEEEKGDKEEEEKGEVGVGVATVV